MELRACHSEEERAAERGHHLAAELRATTSELSGVTATSAVRLSEQRMEAQKLAEQAQGESSEAKRLRLEAVHSYSVWATEREHFWGEIYDLQEELSQRDSLAATLELQAAERDAQHAAHLRSEMGEVVVQVKTLEEEKQRYAEDRAEARADAEKAWRLLSARDADAAATAGRLRALEFERDTQAQVQSLQSLRRFFGEP